MNELLFITTILICISGILIFYKLFGHDGIYLWISIATILAFLASFKTMPLYNFDINCAFPFINSIYISMFILIEKYEKKDTKKVVYVSTFVSLITIIYLLLTYLYTPSIYDNTSVYITKLIDNNIINLIAFPIILGISEYLIIIIYKKVKEIYDETFVKVCLTTIAISLIDIFIYLFIIYINKSDANNFLNIILASFAFKLMAAIIYSPTMYYIEKTKKVKK